MHIRRTAWAVLAAAAALALAGYEDGDLTAKHMQPLSRASKQLIAKKGMTGNRPVKVARGGE